MCQPAPLARCSNHARKQIEKLEKDYGVKSQETLDQSYKISALKREALDNGVHSQDLMDETSTDPRLAELNATRRAWEQSERDKTIIVRDIQEEELHIDATPKGLKDLRENPDVSHRNLRIKNAESLQEWRKGLREAKDSNGNPILSQDADPAERKAFYAQEFSSARNAYAHAVMSADNANAGVSRVYRSLAQYDTKQVKRTLADGTVSYDTVCAEIGSEDSREVAYLNTRKKGFNTALHQANHDQILARAKMNSIKSAVKRERKKDSTSPVNTKVSPKIAEQNQTFDTYTEDLKRAHVTMTIEAQKSDTADNEYLRKKAKANVIGESSKRLSELRQSNSASGATEIFRKEIIEKKKEAEYLEDSSRDSSDKAMYAGAKGAYSLVLDKVRSLN